MLERVGVRPPVRRPYCAPEIALGHGVSPAGDQFALAAIAHEWLSGRRIAGPGAEGFHLPGSSAAGTEAVAAVFCRALDELADARYPDGDGLRGRPGGRERRAGPAGKNPAAEPPVAEAPRLAFDGGDDGPRLAGPSDGPTGPPVAPATPAAAAKRPPATPAQQPPPAPPRRLRRVDGCRTMAPPADEPPYGFAPDDEGLEGDPMAIDPTIGR